MNCVDKMEKNEKAKDCGKLGCFYFGDAFSCFLLMLFYSYEDFMIILLFHQNLS